MSKRVQVIVSEEERERFRREAERRGQSLSSWLREAGLERAAEEPVGRFESAQDVREFFAACDEKREDGREPDWEQHRIVLEDSVRQGTPRT